MKSVAILALVAAVSFLSFAGAWSSVRRPYSKAFEVGTEWAFRAMGLGAAADIEVDGESEACALAHTPGKRERWRAELNVHRASYLPSAAFVALALGSAVALGSRVRRLLAGVVLVHVYAVLNVWVVYVSLAAIHARRCTRHASQGVLSEEWVGELARRTSALLEDPGVVLMGPLLIWALVVLDRRGWSRILPSMEPWPATGDRLESGEPAAGRRRAAQRHRRPRRVPTDALHRGR